MEGESGGNRHLWEDFANRQEKAQLNANPFSQFEKIHINFFPTVKHLLQIDS